MKRFPKRHDKKKNFWNVIIKSTLGVNVKEGLKKFLAYFYKRDKCNLIIDCTSSTAEARAPS